MFGKRPTTVRCSAGTPFGSAFASTTNCMGAPLTSRVGNTIWNAGWSCVRSTERRLVTRVTIGTPCSRHSTTSPTVTRSRAAAPLSSDT
jgi:hypothetical protein